MKKRLQECIDLLEEGGPIAQLIQEKRDSDGDTAEVKDAEERRLRLLASLQTLLTYLNRRAVRVPDLPDWLEGRLETIIERTNSATAAELGQVSSAVKALLDQRKVLLSEVQATAAERIGNRLAEGFDAVSDAEEAAKRAKSSQSRAEKAAKLTSGQADAAKESARLAAEALKLGMANQAEAATASGAAAVDAKAAGDLRDDAKKHRDAAQRSADHALTMEKACADIKGKLDTLLTDESTAIGTSEGFRKEIEDELNVTSKKARKILFEATTAALAQQWRAKRLNAQWIAAFWCLMLFAFVALAVASSIFLIVPQVFAKSLPPEYLASLSKGDGSFQHSILTKLFIVPPLLFAVWFAAVQYAHSRDRQLEYGKREALAKTLEAYQIYLKDLDPDNLEWQREVKALFKVAIEKLYEYLLAPPPVADRTSFRLLRNREYTLEDLAEALGKAKSLGINIAADK